MNRKRKGWIIAIVCACLLVPGAVLHFTKYHLFGDFLLVTGAFYPVMCAIILFAQKHVAHCPSCGYEVINARKQADRTGMVKCPVCGALVFVEHDR